MNENQLQTRITLIRHAPSLAHGRLCGRTDARANCTSITAKNNINLPWGTVDHIVTSPARRCLETIEALWPNVAARPGVTQEPRLWEQDFGDWEGLSLEELPDLGHLGGQELADHLAPNGESFSQVCDRTQAAITDLLETRRGQTLCLCAHAGPIRAALALALGLLPGNALRFQLSCLSMTVLSHFAPGLWSVDQVNAAIDTGASGPITASPAGGLVVDQPIAGPDSGVNVGRIAPFEPRGGIMEESG